MYLLVVYRVRRDSSRDCRRNSCKKTCRFCPIHTIFNEKAVLWGNSKGIRTQESRPQARNPFCCDKRPATWVCNAKGSRGRPQSPLVAPAGAIPPATQKTTTLASEKKAEKSPCSRNCTGKESYLPSFAAITSAAFLPQTRQLPWPMPPIELRPPTFAMPTISPAM